ncbi:MAG: protein kinase [Candidatus Korobacteraceae bacterium]
MGTAGYMSPEQVRGEKLDAGTDIFSFGLVLYEMATGQRAFAGDEVASVQDAILNQTPVPVREQNPAVPAKLEAINNRAIEKQRYQTAAEVAWALGDLRNSEQGSKSPKSKLVSRLAASALVIVSVIARGLYWHSRKPVNLARLTERDTIVITDFANSTGDPVLDDTLKQGLSIQLEQSPFLELVSEGTVNQTLKEMGRQPGEHLTPEITREVCQRTSSKAMVTGSIISLGSQYVLRLEAVDCNMGDSLAEVQETAADRRGVLKPLDKAATGLRSKLGESLSSVQKYATPLFRCAQDGKRRTDEEHGAASHQIF